MNKESFHRSELLPMDALPVLEPRNFFTVIEYVLPTNHDLAVKTKE